MTTKKEREHNKDRALVIVLCILLAASIVGQVYEHYHNRGQIKRAVVSAIRANCKQADLLIQQSVANGNIQDPKDVNRRIRQYYAPLNDALVELHAPKCNVPQLPTK